MYIWLLCYEIVTICMIYKRVRYNSRVLTIEQCNGVKKKVPVGACYQLYHSRASQAADHVLFEVLIQVFQYFPS